MVPEREWNEPRAISKEISSTATTGPKLLVTPRNWISTAPVDNAPVDIALADSPLAGAVDWAEIAT
jgi:hypothetical protein